MNQFFKDSLNISGDVAQKKAFGTAIFKFTANQKGDISKIIIYYADDAVLVTPVVEALRKSGRKWLIPDGEKSHDFLVPFVFSFAGPAANKGYMQKAVYESYRNRSPIVPADQVPLDKTTLLPPVMVSYPVSQ